MEGSLRRILALFILLAFGKHLFSQSLGWITTPFTDELHAQTGSIFTLNGQYLTAPKIAGAPGPQLVVKCIDGKVVESFVRFGAVLDVQSGRIFPVMMESRIDGKKGNIGADNVSTDGTAAFFPRSDLRTMLRAHRVILGADEYLGPE